MAPSKTLSLANGTLRRGTKIGNVAAIACSSVVLLGGLFFGVASCGGEVWHWNAFVVLSGTLYAATTMLPSAWLSSVRSKLLFGIFMLLVFAFARSASSPLYPTVPSSFASYAQAFTKALTAGACN